MYKISCKMDKTFLRYSLSFHHGPIEIFKKPSQGRVNFYKSSYWAIPCTVQPSEKNLRNHICSLETQNCCKMQIFQ